MICGDTDRANTAVQADRRFMTGIFASMGPAPTGVAATWQPTPGRYASVCAPSIDPTVRLPRYALHGVRTRHAEVQLMLRAAQRRRAPPASGPRPILNDCFAPRISASRMTIRVGTVTSRVRKAVSSAVPSASAKGKVGSTSRSGHSAQSDAASPSDRKVAETVNSVCFRHRQQPLLTSPAHVRRCRRC